jgi:hypothetical protein
MSHLPVSQAFYEIRDAHLIDLSLWWAAFTPVLDSAQSADATAAALLGLFADFALIALKTSFLTDEMGYDDLHEHFASIIKLWKMGATASGESWKSKLVGQRGIAYMCALKCRDWDIRREAIRLLREVGEGETGKPKIWDCSMTAAVAEWVMSVEEQGLEFGDTVPVENRLCLAELDVDLRSGIAMVRCVQGKRRMLVEARIKW